jgi:hypothetical protein
MNLQLDTHPAARAAHVQALLHREGRLYTLLRWAGALRERVAHRCFGLGLNARNEPLIGREGRSLTLSRTGALQRALTVEPTPSGAHMGLADAENARKAAALEARLGPLFRLSAEETAQLKEWLLSDPLLEGQQGLP